MAAEFQNKFKRDAGFQAAYKQCGRGYQAQRAFRDAWAKGEWQQVLGRREKKEFLEQKDQVTLTQTSQGG